MVLSDGDILEYLSMGVSLISPFNKGNLGPSSVDLSLDSNIGIYHCDIIEIGQECSSIIKKKIGHNGYLLQPKNFILASTIEEVNIPLQLQGFIETKGNIARAGLQVHNCDGHIDPGFKGKITLEIINNNIMPIKIFSGLPICQIFFFKMLNPPQNPYNGKYQKQSEPTSYLP
ncbi:MAG: dCTP deaminase [Desulfobacteraceae bacterium]|nr:dCTP deaminase [Desulfobacteraceae bacterium]MBC2720888.1 dCTP deaminase [Desulfobacteraceae bacterium]